MSVENLTIEQSLSKRQLDVYIDSSGSGYSLSIYNKPRFTNPFSKEEAELLQTQILYNHKIRQTIDSRIKSLPIFCIVCGEKLTLQNSQSMAWGCSYLGDSGRKPDRSVADAHYVTSVRYLSFENFKHYEELFTELKNIRDGKIKC